MRRLLSSATYQMSLSAWEARGHVCRTATARRHRPNDVHAETSDAQRPTRMVSCLLLLWQPYYKHWHKPSAEKQRGNQPTTGDESY
jgi:hypothetical protein